MIKKRFLAIGALSMTRRVPVVWASDDPNFDKDDVETMRFDALDQEEQEDVLRRASDPEGHLLRFRRDKRST